MTRAMKISAMPRIGVVSRLVRRRASDSCSVASADRNVAHFAARVRATGAPSAALNAAVAVSYTHLTLPTNTVTWGGGGGGGG